MVWLAWIKDGAQIQFQKGKRFIGVIFQQYDISLLLSNTPLTIVPFWCIVIQYYGELSGDLNLFANSV